MEDEVEWQDTWHSLREIVGSKWALHALRLLSTGSYGFNVMKRELDGVTAAMLSRRLKELACHGFVDRSVSPTTPPTTTYSLTESGAEFVGLLVEMEALVRVDECEPDGDVDCASDADGGQCVTLGGRCD